MSIGDYFDFCCGEFPPLTQDDFLRPALGVVDAPLPAQSDTEGSTTVVEALQALDSLCAENAELKTRLAEAEQARDTAQAQATYYRTYYTRTGW